MFGSLDFSAVSLKESNLFFLTKILHLSYQRILMILRFRVFLNLASFLHFLNTNLEYWNYSASITKVLQRFLCNKKPIINCESKNAEHLGISWLQVFIEIRFQILFAFTACFNLMCHTLILFSLLF